MKIGPGKLPHKGLIFAVDAASKRSYPGSGSTLYNMVGGDHMTLYNSPTWSSANGGILQFNGTTQYGVSNINTRTIDSTIIASSRYASASPQGRVVTSYTGNNLLGHHGGRTQGYYSEGWVYQPAADNSQDWRISAAVQNYTSDNWKFYSDNVKLADNASGAFGWNDLCFGSYAGSSEWSDCEIGFCLIYNRLLSEAELSEIFDFYRGRYGL